MSDQPLIESGQQVGGPPRISFEARLVARKIIGGTALTTEEEKRCDSDPVFFAQVQHLYREWENSAINGAAGGD